MTKCLPSYNTNIHKILKWHQKVMKILLQNSSEFIHRVQYDFLHKAGNGIWEATEKINIVS